MNEGRWTPGPWWVATGNSWQRILQARTDAPVIVPTKAQYDGHPDLIGSEKNLQLAATSPELFQRLEASTKLLIAERDVLYDSITDADGNIVEPADGEELQELEREIAANQAVLAKARGESSDA